MLIDDSVAGVCSAEELVSACDERTWGGLDCGAAPCASAAGGCPELDFVFIIGGSFMMGSDREGPIHDVNIPSFEVMRTEIKVTQYRTCVNANVVSAPSTGLDYN